MTLERWRRLRSVKRQPVSNAVYMGLTAVFVVALIVLFRDDSPLWLFVVVFALYWGSMAVLRLRQPRRAP